MCAKYGLTKRDGNDLFSEGSVAERERERRGEGRGRGVM